MTELEPLLEATSASRTSDPLPTHLIRPGMSEGLETRKYEQPWHRNAAYLIATGMPLGEVAKGCDVGNQTISALVRTPWFQELVLKLMSEQGRDVMDMVKAEAVNSLLTMVALRDDPKVSASVRTTNAKSIFEFAQGKAIQRIESNTVLSSSDPVVEEKRLREENARLNNSLSGARPSEL